MALGKAVVGTCTLAMTSMRFRLLDRQVSMALQVPATSATFTRAIDTPSWMPGASGISQASPEASMASWEAEVNGAVPMVPVIEAPVGAGSEELPQAAAKATTARRAILRMKSPVRSGVGGGGASRPPWNASPPPRFPRLRRGNRTLRRWGEARRETMKMRAPKQENCGGPVRGGAARPAARP